MKQARKNKTNQSVTWPTSTFFTIRELCKLNENFVVITLRVRLANAIADGKIVEVGFMPGGKGRPQKVFTQTKVTQLLLDEAEKRGITLVDRAREKLINVVSVNSKPTIAPIVNPIAMPTTAVAK